MTKPIWLQIREHVEANPEHQKLSQIHTDIIKKENEKNSTIRANTFKLQRLLIARDAVNRYATELECSSTVTDDELETLTANHGECWLGMFNGAADDITEYILDLCDLIHQQKSERQEFINQRDEAYKNLKSCADSLEAEYKKLHAGTAGPAD